MLGLEMVSVRHLPKVVFHITHGVCLPPFCHFKDDGAGPLEEGATETLQAYVKAKAMRGGGENEHMSVLAQH